MTTLDALIQHYMKTYHGEIPAEDYVKDLRHRAVTEIEREAARRLAAGPQEKWGHHWNDKYLTEGDK